VASTAACPAYVFLTLGVHPPLVVRFDVGHIAPLLIPSIFTSANHAT
jgi:hypothetical protein